MDSDSAGLDDFPPEVGIHIPLVVLLGITATAVCVLITGTDCCAVAANVGHADLKKSCEEKKRTRVECQPGGSRTQNR
jgi:hypothetical protein